MHRNRLELWTTCLAIAALCALFAASASADPIVGRDLLKFSQKPMDGTPITEPQRDGPTILGPRRAEHGVQQLAPAGPTPYRGTFMADDFADKFNSPVVHVKWWGSYLNNFCRRIFRSTSFLISFESDVPAESEQSIQPSGTAAVEPDREARAVWRPVRARLRRSRSAAADHRSAKRCTSTTRSCIWARSSSRSRTRCIG